jgi:hypothetical protein
LKSDKHLSSCSVASTSWTILSFIFSNCSVLALKHKQCYTSYGHSTALAAPPHTWFSYVVSIIMVCGTRHGTVLYLQRQRLPAFSTLRWQIANCKFIHQDRGRWALQNIEIIYQTTLCHIPEDTLPFTIMITTNLTYKQWNYMRNLQFQFWALAVC